MNFGRWKVLQAEGRKWLCLCVCGVELQLKRAGRLIVVFDGQPMTLAQISEKTGIRYNTLRARFAKGKRPPELFSPGRQATQRHGETA